MNHCRLTAIIALTLAALATLGGCTSTSPSGSDGSIVLKSVRGFHVGG